MTFAQAQTAGYVATEKEYQALINKALDDYKRSFNAIQKQLRKLYLDTLAGIPAGEYFNYMTKYGRLQGLLDGIAEEYRKVSLAAGRLQTQASALAMSNNYYRQQYVFNWTEQASDVFVVLPAQAVNVSVFGTPEIWQEISAANRERWSNLLPQGGTLSEVLATNRANDLARIRRVLTSNLIQGNSFTRTARELQNVFRTARNNAIRIARTEGIRNLNAGVSLLIDDLRREGVNAVRRWDATLDSRVRPTHAAADNQAEDKNGLFHVGGATGAYPGNMSSAKESINCRCKIYTDIDGVGPELRRARNPVTGETDIISFTDFETWRIDNGLRYNASGRLVNSA